MAGRQSSQYANGTCERGNPTSQEPAPDGRHPGQPRRSYGSGSLFVRADAQGRETWYGTWWSGGRRVKRRLGAKRAEGRKEGLTRAQAEAELRRQVEAERNKPSVAARVTVKDAGERLIAHRESLGRRQTTLNTYRSLLNTHLVSFFEDKPLSQIGKADVERFMLDRRRQGSSPKLTRNAPGLLHGIFDYGQRNGWCARNPCDLVDKPRLERNADIRYLDQQELDALVQAVPSDTPYGPSDRALFLTAAMPGLRQGELLALRWADIDWPAARVRVRRSYVRGVWGAPKSRRSSRSMPMADRVARELELHFQRSRFQRDSDLVFADPHSGNVQDHSYLVRRFKKALKASGVRQVRFHDLRHTFGTRMAAAGVPMRTLQEWLGHSDHTTTLIYADYAPSAHEAALVDRAFAPGSPENWNHIGTTASDDSAPNRRA